MVEILYKKTYSPHNIHNCLVHHHHHIWFYVCFTCWHALCLSQNYNLIIKGPLMINSLSSWVKVAESVDYEGIIILIIDTNNIILVICIIFSIYHLINPERVNKSKLLPLFTWALGEMGFLFLHSLIYYSFITSHTDFWKLPMLSVKTYTNPPQTVHTTPTLKDVWCFQKRSVCKLYVK